MKKRLTTAMLTLVLVMAMAAAPAQALQYDVEEPDEGMFAPSSSVEEVIVVGGGPTEQSNIDRSKNASLAPPSFGSPDSYQPGTGEVLIPHVAYDNYVSSGSTGTGNFSGSNIVGGSGTTGTGGNLYVPPAVLGGSSSSDVSVSTTGDNKFTLPDGLYYSDGSLGRLKIPKLDLNVKVYEDESLENLAKGAGHFKSTACWDGNVGIAGHNRGVTNHFGKIHTLTAGDQIVYTTQLGTRTYEVFYVGQISETDFSRLDRTSENIITLITCVRDVRDMRWCIQAREIS